MQFLYYTTFRLYYFHVFCQNLSNFKMGRWGFNYIYKFFLEYFDGFIIFIYIIYLRILDKYDNSSLLKQVRIILLTIVIFWVSLVTINFKLYKVTNKHPFVTILKRYPLLFVFSYYYFVKQIPKD